VDGAFTDPANWVDQNGHHGVPGPADNAFVNFNNITVTVPTSVSVNSLSVGATPHITGGATLSLAKAAASSQISPLALDGDGTLQVTGGSTKLNGTSTVAGAFDVAPSATLLMGGARASNREHPSRGPGSTGSSARPPSPRPRPGR
jgi:hypothetical protein